MKNQIAKLIVPLTVGIGTGLAMLPVFNHELKELEEFDIHDSSTVFTISTINTLLVTTFISTSAFYNFLNTEDSLENTQPNIIHKSLIFLGALCSAMLPIGILWDVELQNREVEESQGFDEYIAWATFTTIPLLISTVSEDIEILNRHFFTENNIVLDSIGSKIFVYGISTLSALGRGIVCTAVSYRILEETGMSENQSLAISIPFFGVIGSSVIAIADYQIIKDFFKKDNNTLNINKVTFATLSSLEGAWFSLPLISVGLNFVEEWNPLIKGCIFAPLFISNTLFESAKLFNNGSVVANSIYNEAQALFNNVVSEEILLLGNTENNISYVDSQNLINE